MSKTKLLASLATPFFLAGCAKVSEDVAYCVRTGNTSFEIRTDMTSPPTTLLIADNLKINTVTGAFEGKGKSTEPGNGSNYRPFKADIREGTCESLPYVFPDTYKLR